MSKSEKPMRGYKIDFTSNTIIMNYKFAAAAEQYNTPEYQLIQKIMKDFPGMTRVVRAGRRVKKAALNKRLTYANMEQHMSVYPNAAELLERFEVVKGLSKTCASPYKYVGDWFRAQFPNYKGQPKFTANQLAVALVEAPDKEKYQQKEKAKEAA